MTDGTGVTDEAVEVLARRLHRERYLDGVQHDAHVAEMWESAGDRGRAEFRERARRHLTAVLATGTPAGYQVECSDVDLRRSWAAMSTILTQLGRWEEPHPDDLARIPSPHVSLLLGQAALQRQVREVYRRHVQATDALSGLIPDGTGVGAVIPVSSDALYRVVLVLRGEQPGPDLRVTGTAASSQRAQDPQGPIQSAEQAYVCKCGHRDHIAEVPAPPPAGSEPGEQ